MCKKHANATQMGQVRHHHARYSIFPILLGYSISIHVTKIPTPIDNQMAERIHQITLTLAASLWLAADELS